MTAEQKEIKELKAALLSSKEANAELDAKVKHAEKTISKLEKELADQNALTNTAESKVDEVQDEKLKLEERLTAQTEKADAAELLLQEQNAFMKEKESAVPGEKVITHEKQKYIQMIPRFGGIPGYPKREFTHKDLSENTAKVTFKGEDISLVDYLLVINSSVIKEKI